MRREVVVCDMCGSEADIRDWAHLPFKKQFISGALKTFQRIDICGRSCEHDFNVYYEHFIGGTAYEFS